MAGNAYAQPTRAGILITPSQHYFRTNSDRVKDYLSQFTEWHPGSEYVNAFPDGWAFRAIRPPHQT